MGWTFHFVAFSALTTYMNDLTCISLVFCNLSPVYSGLTRTVINVNYKDTSDVCLYINVSLNWDCCKWILIWISRLDVHKSRIKVERNVKFVAMLNLISYICLAMITCRCSVQRELEIIHYEFSVKQPMSQWYIYI